MSRILVCTGSLVLIAIVLGCGGNGNRKGGGTSETNPGDVEKVSTKELLRSYSASEANADKKYKEKFLEIEAYVVKGTDNIETKRLIVSAEKGGPSILCLFDAGICRRNPREQQADEVGS